MAVIGQQAFVLAPNPDKYLSLANEEFVRRLDLSLFDNNWKKIRIGLNCSFTNTGGGDLSNFKLFVGLCSGTTYPFQSQQCLNAVGYIWGHWDTVQNAGYVAGGGNPYYAGGISYYGLRKVGQNINSATIGSASWAFTATGGSTERRGWLCGEIERNATQGFPGGKTLPSTSTSGDVWYEHSAYVNGQGGQPYVLENAAPSNTQGFTFGAGWDTNPLDTVDIYWHSNVYALRIYSIWVCFTP